MAMFWDFIILFLIIFLILGIAGIGLQFIESSNAKKEINAFFGAYTIEDDSGKIGELELGLQKNRFTIKAIDNATSKITGNFKITNMKNRIELILVTDDGVDISWFKTMKGDLIFETHENKSGVYFVIFHLQETPVKLYSNEFEDNPYLFLKRIE